MAVSSLQEVLVSLSRQVGNDASLAPVCTRVMLRTGVNLRAPRADQVGDSGVLGKVLLTLSEMGYPL